MDTLIRTLVAVGFFLCPASSLLAESPFDVVSEYDFDLSKHQPWQKPQLMPHQITDDINEKMTRFSRVFGAGNLQPSTDKNALTDAELKDVVSTIHKELPFDPAAPGKRRVIAVPGGKPGPHADPKQPMLDIKTTGRDLLNKVYWAYRKATPEQVPQIEECYRRVAQAVIANENNPSGANSSGWLDNGYKWRNYGGHYASMAYTLPPDERMLLLDTLAHISGAPLFGKKPWANVDQQLNFFGIAFQAIASMENGPVKWQRIQAFRRGLDLATITGNAITPDGGIIHHEGHHLSYAGYGFGTAIGLQQKFAQTGISGEHSNEAARRFRTAAQAWGFNTLGGLSPLPTQLRPYPHYENSRSNGGGGHASGFAIKAAQLTAALNGKDIKDDYQMARIAASKSRGNINAVPEYWRHFAEERGERFLQPLSGHLSFPVMGIATHRRRDWVVMLRGANRFYRLGEVYSRPQMPEAYLDRLAEGAMYIFSHGANGRSPNPVDSGLRLEGYNPNWFPNVTASFTPNGAMAGRKFPDYFFPHASLGGGASLNGNGVWGWGANHVRKSAFFVNSRITLLTTGINPSGKDMRTTLLQEIHDIVDEKPIVPNVLASASSVWSDDLTPARLTDYSGLQGGKRTEALHREGGGSEGMWHTKMDVTTAVLNFDLKGTYDLSDVYIWQHNQTNMLDRGVKQFDVLTSTDGKLFTEVITNETLPMAKGGLTGPQRFPMKAKDVTHVRINIDSNYGGVVVGLSEVLFTSVRRKSLAEARFDAAPFYADGHKVAATATETLPGNESHTLLDAFSTGYYIPAGNPMVKIERGDQGYRYIRGDLLKPGMEGPKGELSGQAMVGQYIDRYNPIVRPASMAYFDHDADPTIKHCAFTTIIKTNAAQLNRFKQMMEGPNPPHHLTYGTDYHSYKDRLTGTSCLVVFRHDVSIKGALVTSVNRPSTLIWSQSKNGLLKLEIASTDQSDQRPFRVVLRGRWILKREPGAAVHFNGTETQLEAKYINQVQRSFLLRKTAEQPPVDAKPRYAFHSKNVVGRWKAKTVPKQFTLRHWNVTRHMVSPGDYTFTFQFKSGNNALRMKNIALTRDKKVVGKSDAEGVAGGQHSNNVLRVHIDHAIEPGSDWSLNAEISGSDGTVSNGEIWLERVVK